jgi:hypothetical protein
MKTSPIQAVKARFGDKQKLVSAVQALATDELWLDRVNETKGLAKVSNSKLLHLHDTLTSVKKDFGSRAKLIESILSLGKRDKDAGLKSALEKFSTPHLVDLQTSAAKRAKVSAKNVKAPVKKAKKKPRTKKAKEKAAAGAKEASAKAGKAAKKK